jgi:hypothetical protein
MTRRLWYAALFMLIAAVTTSPAHAQRITGRVVEDGTDRGIGYAQVSLVARDSNVVASALADSVGYFVIDAAAGTYRVRTTGLGYATFESDTIPLRPGEVLNIVLRLSIEGIPLAPLEVRARARDEPGRFGFARRQALGKGYFLTDDSIAVRQPVVATDAFYGIPRIDILDNGTGSPQVLSWSGAKCLAIFLDNMPRPIEMAHAPTNANLRIGLFGKGSGYLNQYTDVKRIRAIEIYRDWSEVPRELRTAMRVGYLMREPSRSSLSRLDGSLREIEPCGLAWVWTDLGW